MENTDDFIEFRIDQDKKLLYGKWLRNVNNEEYKAGLQHVYKLIDKYQIKLWLQNSEQLEPRSVEDQKWVSEEFGFLLIQSPVKYLAIVTPRQSPHYAVLLSLREKAYRIFGKAKQMEIFESDEEGIGWLIPNMQHYRLPVSSFTISSDQPR